MGLFDGLKKHFGGNRCKVCKAELQLLSRQLYRLPMTVGHYSPHTDALYYLKNARPVANKAEIPTGYYACGAKVYRCPDCRKRIVTLDIFLPVRDQEMQEDILSFEKGELDELPGLSDL